MKLKTLTQQTFLFAFATLCASNIVALQQSERPEVVLCDIGYVLAKPNTMKMSLRNIIPKTCGFNPVNVARLGVLYKRGLLTSNGIQAQMDAVMDNARPNEPKQTEIVDQHGHPHTNIDADYQRGTKSDASLFAEIQQSIQSLEEADMKKAAEARFFYNPAHKYLIQQTLAMRYTQPKFFGEAFTPIKEGVSILEKCNKAGTRLAILSNWGAESFPYLKAHQQDTIFKYFKPEDIFASGEIKQAKPHAAAFEHVVQTMGVPAHKIVFIDDQIVNVEAARKIGMQAIHLTNYKDPAAYAQVEAELKNLGAL